MDTYTLNNGMKLPKIGFGTCALAGGKECEAIKSAMTAGMKYFDTASLYQTERALGQAIKEGGIDRSELIIATKAWWDELGYKEVKEALKRSLDRLGLQYVDIYLIHWPRTANMAEYKQLDADTWKAMEEMVDEGYVKALGLSNFLPHHIDNILEHARIKPVVDQLELHPGYSQERAVSYCLEHDILPQAWSPLGRGRVSELTDGALKMLAEKYGKSTAQISLNFLVSKGIMPLPKASSIEHIIANMGSLDFSMDSEDISLLSCMPQTAWLGEHPDYVVPTKTCSRNQ